jgi:hypothetical protein
VILVLHDATYAACAVAGLLMVKAGSVKHLVESKQRVRWCAACHRRITDGRCGCSARR